MTNAELIKALRNCAFVDMDASCFKCQYWRVTDCKRKMLRDTADALEAADKRIVDLETALAACRARKGEAPKRGEWIESNTRPRSAQFDCSVCHRTCYDIQPTRDKAWAKRCRYHYCPNCGADMQGGHDGKDL